MKPVNLPEEIYEAIEIKLSEFGFSSVEEYVIFVLRESLEEEQGEVVLAEEERELRKRLSDLGYIE
jgi:Fe2+ transport system protein FeoA